jgi:hypothetical protein
MHAEHAADVGEIGVVPHEQGQLGSGRLAGIGAAIDGAPHRREDSLHQRRSLPGR